MNMKITSSSIGYIMVFSAFLLGSFLTKNYYTAQIHKIEAKHNAQLATSLGSSLSALSAQNHKINIINSDYRKAIKELEDEKSNLTQQLHDGSIRVSILNSALSAERTNSNTCAQSRNDGTTIELSREAQQIILDLQDGIKKDRAKIIGLQNYIHSLEQYHLTIGEPIK